MVSIFRSRLRWLVKLLFAATLLLVVASLVGWREIGHTLLNVDLRLVSLGWGISLVSRYGEAFQMSRLMRHVGMTVGPLRILLANSLSVLYGMILPGDIVAAAAKWMNLAAYTGKRSLVLNAIVYNRPMLLMPWLVAGALALALHNPWNSQAMLVAVIGLATVVTMGFLMLYGRRTGPKLDAIALAVSHRVAPVWVEEKLGYLFRSLGQLRELPWHVHARILGLGIINMAIQVILFIIMAAAVEIDISWYLLVWTRAALVLVRQLPVTFNGIGVREGTLVAILGQFGVAEEAAFSLGVLGFTNIAMFACVGGIYQIALTFGWSRSGVAAHDEQLAAKPECSPIRRLDGER